MGRTPGFTEIEINGEGREMSGAILKARATGCGTRHLIGERLS